jgi:hypothetical protein
MQSGETMYTVRLTERCEAVMASRLGVISLQPECFQDGQIILPIDLNSHQTEIFIENLCESGHVDAALNTRYLSWGIIGSAKLDEKVAELSVSEKEEVEGQIRAIPLGVVAEEQNP